MSRKSKVNDSIKVKGFIHLQIVDDDGRVIGDRCVTNTVTNNGKNDIAALVGAVSGSYQVGYAAIGNGSTSSYATNTDLNTRQNSFMAVSNSTVGASTGVFQATASFAGSNNSATITVQEVGLFKTNSAGSMVAATTFTGSQMATNQNLNLTYQIQFS